VLDATSSAIIVHGGAGLVGEERHARLREGGRRAAEAGDAILIAGGSALDAVVAAVRVLEDDPEFNAGTGSALTRDGTVETDASIMDGATHRVGAVAAVPNLGNAIALARAVLEANEHVILSGPSAWEFAREVGISPATNLVTDRARARLAAKLDEKSGGTVGAVARDRHGKFAAATSTGGIVGKRPGRIGDSPIAGAGTWADARCALSATGDGEAILRVALTRSIAMRLELLQESRVMMERYLARQPADIAEQYRRTDIDEAAAFFRMSMRVGLQKLAKITGGSAGVIGVDEHGVIGLQLSPTMPIASIVRGLEIACSDSMGEVIV
jgi:beta-aspartyl-peptidase (threonine type)